MEDIIEHFFTQKGIVAPEDRAHFITPPYQLGNVWHFADIKKAVQRINDALVAGEHIGIYADYDCDGIPAAVVLLDLFRQLGKESFIHVYIPDRHHEGYGMKSIGIEALRAHGVTLIITVDMGITALAEVQEAQEKGIDVIVTDHHAPLMQSSVVEQSEQKNDTVKDDIFDDGLMQEGDHKKDVQQFLLPQAYAVVHPMHGTYSNTDLCGAGVAFMLVRAFIELYGKVYNIPEGWEKWLLDIVAFATVSDMMPLSGENRTIVLYGLKVFRKTRRAGLLALCVANGIHIADVTEQDMSFTVAPRLNAASRMASPMLAFELLATTDQRRAIELAAELTRINDMRKALVKEIVAEAQAMITERILTQGALPEAVVIGALPWRPAVLGLVANKLQELFQRSFFVWGEGGDGTIKGSCRMLPQHHAAHMFQALPEGVLLHSGGHQAAGGFATTKETIHLLEQALNDTLQKTDISKIAQSASEHAVSQHNRQDGLQNSVDPDSENQLLLQEIQTLTPLLVPLSVPLSVISTKNYHTLRTLAPFGIGNPEPLLLFERVVVQGVKKFGKQKEHLECTFFDGVYTTVGFTFFVSEVVVQAISAGMTLSCTGTIDPGYKGGARIHIKEFIFS